MFERGIFSFIPAVLLEMYAGAAYKLLPIKAQTLLINQIGLTAAQTEWTAAAIDRALVKSRKAINDVLQEPKNIKENIADLLQNIASGNAPARQEDTMCLLTAAKMTCQFADRDSCIGCGYEILTKTAMHTLMREYKRLSNLQNSNGDGAWRYAKMLDQAILPAISEMLSAMRMLYGADTDELLDIVERGLVLDNHSV